MAPFTRAAGVMYFMLNIIAGPGGENLGDILGAECGMSDLLLYDHSVYRCPGKTAGQSSMTFENFIFAKTPAVVSIQSGDEVLERRRAV